MTNTTAGNAPTETLCNETVGAGGMAAPGLFELKWGGARIMVRAKGWPAEGNMPDYVSLIFGGNAISASFCLTPSDARALAHLIYSAAMDADAERQLSDGREMLDFVFASIAKAEGRS